MSIRMVHLTWTEFDRAVNKIAKQISEVAEGRGVDLEGIVGQTRGGLPLAVALSHKLDIPVFDDPIKPMEGQEDNSRIVWVDDIIDSGKTLYETKSYFEFGFYASWVTKIEVTTCSTPIWYAEKAFDHVWYVFPWECIDKAQADMEQYIDSRK